MYLDQLASMEKFDNKEEISPQKARGVPPILRSWNGNFSLCFDGIQ